MSSSVRVLVDDFDPRIAYTPADKWVKGGGQFEHNSTTHGMVDGTGSFSFKFNGTSVDVFATIPYTSTVYPNATCTVDGTKISSFVPKDSSYNYMHCQSPTLSDDQEHTLEVDIVSTTTAWYLDYMIYGSTINEKRLVGPDGAPVQIIVDDADSRVVYEGPSGAWSTRGSQYEYNSTTHATQTGGATATFKFYGSAIQVFGTVDSDKSLAAFTSTYAVDGGSSVNYQPPTLDNYAVQMRFFQSSTLEEAEHTLVITETSEGALKYILDFLVYSVTPTALISAPTPSPSPSPTDGDNHSGNENSDKKSPNTGLIAGVSVGAVVILAGLALFAFFLWRRKKRNSGRPHLDLSTPPTGPHDAPLVQPFLQDNARHSTSSFTPYGHPPMSQRSSGWGGSGSSSGPLPAGTAISQYAADSHYASTDAHHGDYHGPLNQSNVPASDVNSTYPSTSLYASSTTPPTTAAVASEHLRAGKGPINDALIRQPQQHVDGGVRLAGDRDDEQLDDLPPVYQASY